MEGGEGGGGEGGEGGVKRLEEGDQSEGRIKETGDKKKFIIKKSPASTM